MSRFPLKLSTVATLAVLVLTGVARAQDAPDPLDRYKRDPLPRTRLGEDTETGRGPIEPQFQDLPNFDADPLPPLDDGEGVPVKPPTKDSGPPPGAFAPEPDAFGPPRGTFRLPSSIGAPGIPAPAKKPKVSSGASAPDANAASNGAVANAAPGEPVPEMNVPPAAKEEFESGVLPAPEDWQVDERAARERELAIPDEYLDPEWPDDGSASRIAPEESDSVEEVPIGDDAEIDQAEREDAERYKEALGINASSDEFKQDDSGDTSADRTRDRDRKEYEDPAEW